MKTGKIISFPKSLTIKRNKWPEIAEALEEEVNAKPLVFYKNMSEYIIEILKKHLEKQAKPGSSNVYYFIEKCVTFDVEAPQISILDIYQSYIEFCKINSWKPFPFSHFARLFYEEAQKKVTNMNEYFSKRPERRTVKINLKNIA